MTTGQLYLTDSTKRESKTMNPNFNSALIAKFVLLITILISFQPICYAKSPCVYLYQPTGPYQVSYSDFHWTNTKICPDPMAPNNSKNNFSKLNKARCRELMVRIFYPTISNKAPSSPYPKYVISMLKESLGNLSPQLDNICINAQENLPIAKQKFPLIIFSSGAVDNAQEYTNLLINLTSHGYIVAAINGTFLTTVSFPDGRIIPANSKLLAPKSFPNFYEMKFNDIQFVYNQLMLLHKEQSNPIFDNILPDQVGLLGHSAGASAVVAMGRVNSSEIKAAVALDAPNQTDPSTNVRLREAGITLPAMFNVFDKFNLPFMQIHSSYAPTFLSTLNANFKLSQENYLVTIQLNNQNDYFEHMDYSDFTLFKNLPSIPKNNDFFDKNLYGTINGKLAIDTVSTYLISFFNQFLKNDSNHAFEKCNALTNNTTIKCGTAKN